LISRNRGEVCEEGFQEQQNNSVKRSMLMWLLQCLRMAHVSLELFPCLFKVVKTWQKLACGIHTVCFSASSTMETWTRVETCISV